MNGRIQDQFRLVVAGLFVFAGMIAVGVFLSSRFRDLPFWMIPLMLVVFAILIFAVIIFFNLGNKISRRGLGGSDLIEDLGAKGLLSSAAYNATRAFEVAEFDEEGSHYFLELA